MTILVLYASQKTSEKHLRGYDSLRRWLYGANTEPGYSFSLVPIHSEEVRDRITGSKDDLGPSPLVTGLIDNLLSGDEIELEVRDIELLESTSYNAFFHYVDGGLFYRIDEETLEKGTVTGLKYEVSRSGVEQDIPEEDLLPMSDLPYHDQWLLYDSLSISDTGGVIPFSDTLVAGYLDSDYQADSLLVNGIDKQFVKFSDRYIKLEEQGEHSSSIERVRYTAELVGEDPVSFGEYVTKRYAVKASDLSTDAQDLLDRIDEGDGSFSTSEDDEDFESYGYVIEEIRSKAQEKTDLDDLNLMARPNQKNSPYIQYEGERYSFSRTHWGAP